MCNIIRPLTSNSQTSQNCIWSSRLNYPVRITGLTSYYIVTMSPFAPSLLSNIHQSWIIFHCSAVYAGNLEHWPCTGFAWNMYCCCRHCCWTNWCCGAAWMTCRVWGSAITGAWKLWPVWIVAEPRYCCWHAIATSICEQQPSSLC